MLNDRDSGSTNSSRHQPLRVLFQRLTETCLAFFVVMMLFRQRVSSNDNGR